MWNEKAQGIKIKTDPENNSTERRTIRFLLFASVSFHFFIFCSKPIQCILYSARFAVLCVHKYKRFGSLCHLSRIYFERLLFCILFESVGFVCSSYFHPFLCPVEKYTHKYTQPSRSQDEKSQLKHICLTEQKIMGNDTNAKLNVHIKTVQTKYLHFLSLFRNIFGGRAVGRSECVCVCIPYLSNHMYYNDATIFIYEPFGINKKSDWCLYNECRTPSSN